MKKETKQDVEWVVAEDHPPLFECDYLNEPHEERNKAELTPYPASLERDDICCHRIPTVLCVICSVGPPPLDLNPDYLHRNAEANRYAAYRVSCLTSPPCTPSRDAITFRGNLYLGEIE